MATGRTDITDIVLKRGTAARWSAVNPVLKQGEPGFEYDTNKLKIGDGSTAWNLLPYQGGSITLTTNGTTGAATLVASVLNIPQYSAGGGITRSINVVSGNTTAGSSAATDYVYIVTASAIITLPSAVSNTNRYTVKNASGVNISVAFTGGQNADGSTSITLTPNTALDFISDNSNYKVI